MAKDARIPMRVPEALKEEFEWAAEQDGARGVSTWLRQLGEERAEQLRMAEQARADGRPPIEQARDAQKQLNNARAAAGPALAFVPDFGLDEED